MDGCESWFLFKTREILNPKACMNPILFLQLYYYFIWFVQLYWNLMLMSFEDKNTCAILSWFYCSFMRSINILAFQSNHNLQSNSNSFISATPVFACRRRWFLTAKYFCWLSPPALSEPPYSSTQRPLRLLPEKIFKDIFFPN